jgi:YgiT-type zinc finger domain-containing protein
MKCIVCKQADTRPGTTTVTLERGWLTLVVKKVPAQKCPNCGEAYTDEATTAHLLATAEQMAAAGIVQPLSPVEGHDGQIVIITFLEEGVTDAEMTDSQVQWQALKTLLETCTIETGIEDLAHHHDYYLYGKPKDA